MIKYQTIEFRAMRPEEVQFDKNKLHTGSIIIFQSYSKAYIGRAVRPANFLKHKREPVSLITILHTSTALVLNGTKVMY